MTSDTDLLTLKPGDGRLHWKRGSSVHVCHQVPEDDVTVMGAKGWTCRGNVNTDDGGGNN